MTINYTVGGSAASGRNFIALPGSATIPTGQSSTPITITPINNPVYETASTVSITITPGDYAIGQQDSANISILQTPPTAVAAWGNNNHGQTTLPVGLGNVVAIDGGESHSLALKSDRTVVAWGDNTYGQCSIPAGLNNAKAISAGPRHSLVLKTDGTVVGWGLNDAGSLDIPAGLNGVVSVKAGTYHGLALKGNGTVVAWGANDFGQATVPVGLNNVVAIAAGVYHSVALKGDGTVVAWGANTYGQTAVPVGLNNVMTIASGSWHTLALKKDGTVVAWGSNGYGQCDVPAGLSGVISVEAPWSSSLCLKSDGTMLGWGYNWYGEVTMPGGLAGVTAIGGGGGHTLVLGALLPLIFSQPASQIIPPGGNVTFSVAATSGTPMSYQWQFNGSDIVGATGQSLLVNNVQPANAGNYSVKVSNSAGTTTSATATLTLLAPPVITSQSQPLVQRVNAGPSSVTLSVTASENAPQAQYPLSYVWKLNGTVFTSYTPSSYAFFPDAAHEGIYTVTVQNAAGSVTSAPWTVWVTSAGSVIGWGNGEYGATVPFGFSGAAAVAAGILHSLALNENGTVTGWGDNSYGQLNVPSNLSDVVAIAAGFYHCLALKSDGTIVGWGNNQSGEATPPGGLSGVMAIGAGANHSVALKSDGTVVAWGDNTYGQTTIPQGLGGLVSIAGGGIHNLALKSDGTVVAWGGNQYGQASVPPGLSGVVSISAGLYHSLAVKNDGTVVAWGYNGFGQTTVPPGLNNVMSVAAGGFHSMALKNDGTVVAWGSNSSGQSTVPAGVTGITSVAANLYQSLALEFSPTIQYYPLDVTKDLLLVYNSASSDSISLKDYYLANRPMISGTTNVLGIPITVQGAIPNYADPGECVSYDNYQNQILAGFANWLAANPTKRPQYVILFLKIPAKIVDVSPSFVAYDNSVSYSLSQAVSGYHPFITHINMGNPADHSGNGDLAVCKAYVDKLTLFGNTYSPGKIVISASRGGYGNNHYYFDDKINGSTGPGRGGDALNAVLAADPSAVVTYVYDMGSPSILSGANVAGYMSHGIYNPGLAGGDYALPPLGNDKIAWAQGDSSWYIIQTMESYNGFRFNFGLQGTFLKWFSSGAFGGLNYSNTPVGGVSHVNEPAAGLNDTSIYFGSWAAGKNFAICAWASRATPSFQAVGDPFVAR